jgi:hypothetical protein
MYLTEDITGPYSGTAYGCKGDQVELISEHGEMVIVKGTAQSFSVKRDQLSQEKVMPAAKKTEPVVKRRR